MTRHYILSSLLMVALFAVYVLLGETVLYDFVRISWVINILVALGIILASHVIADRICFRKVK